MSEIWKKYNYDHVHDAALMAYILKKLAGADKLQAMKLVPAPNLNKANVVGKYRFILQSVNSWSTVASSYADSTSCNNSSQEECLKVAKKQHWNKKQSSKSSKKSIGLSISDFLNKEERKLK